MLNHVKYASNVYNVQIFTPSLLEAMTEAALELHTYPKIFLQTSKPLFIRIQ